MKVSEPDPDFETLLDFLAQSRGFDFSGYKRASLVRRMCKRIETLKINNFRDYQDYLEVHPDEFILLFNTILINVTSFFRDGPSWEYLDKLVIPRIIAALKADESVRVWSTGCATGEETYSLAILLAEALGEQAFKERVKIYATDIDEEALAQARQGGYSADKLKPVPKELCDKYFEKVNDLFVFRADLRRCIIFGRHDLIQDAPISRIQLLICRNTLMYMNAETQKNILDRFHFALQEGGYLFLGRAEMLLTHARLFTPVELKYRIFAKVLSPNRRDRLPANMDAETEAVPPAEVLNNQIMLRESAFDAALVAQVVVNADGNLLLVNERARALFNLKPKDIGRPLQDLELSYRPAELHSLIEQVYTERRPVTLTNIERNQAGGAIKYLDVQVKPLQPDGNQIRGVSITFNDVSRFHKLKEDLQNARQELETAYEELQSTNEELQTTNEELQSTVEELETTNEELQSSNEEMETMNEELQSTNEELQTLNDELRERTDDYNTANLFLYSILASVRLGVVVMDRDFNIRIWNQRSEDLWGLRSEEVQGQSLIAIDIGLPVDKLTAPLREVLSGKSTYQEIILPAMNRRGKAITCRLTCTPLLGQEKERQGVVLLMEELNQ